MKNYIRLGALLTTGAFPIALLYTLEHRPWPWGYLFGALALGTIALALWSLRPQPRLPAVPKLPKAGRRAALLAPLALLLPRRIMAAQRDTFREAALVDRRAWRRGLAVQMAIAHLAPGLRARWPWHDVPQFANNIEWALSCGGTPEEVVTWAADPEQWTLILSRLRPGSDVLGAVREAMSRDFSDAEIEGGEVAALRAYRQTWQEYASSRSARLPQVLRTLGAALALVLLGCAPLDAPSPDLGESRDLPHVLQTDSAPPLHQVHGDLAACPPSVPLDTIDNCGSCGHSCRGTEQPGFPAVCCPPTNVWGGGCAILNTDSHCGRCGDECWSGTHCVEGRCL